MSKASKNANSSIILLSAHQKFRPAEAPGGARHLSRASSHVLDVAKCHSLQPIGKPELASIHALFAWVANEQKFAEETVASITETKFGVSRIANLKQKDYDEVIQFLVDLRIQDVCN